MWGGEVGKETRTASTFEEVESSKSKAAKCGGMMDELDVIPLSADLLGFEFGMPFLILPPS